MRNFAFGKAQTIAQAASAAGLVAEAMLVADGGAQSQDVRVVKAGGIDLIDLMKEGLLAPTEVTSLQGVPGLDAIAPTPEGGLRVGPMVTLARLAADRAIRDRYPALADAAGESASPQIRAVATLGGNLLQRPRCWYFRAAEFRCLRKGGGHCYAISGENQYHAIFDNRFCAIVHPSTSRRVKKLVPKSSSLLRRENSLFFEKNSLLCLQKFPVSLRREFVYKPLNQMND